jgi:hypothetical protein
MDFLTERNYLAHVAKGIHSFPKGIRAKDKLVLMASSGFLAAGSRPNRMAGSTKPVIACQAGAAGEEAARCYKRYNRKEESQSYRKPEMLVKVLKQLYHHEDPKLDEYAMRDRMKNMRDEKDSGLMFCYAKRGTPMPTGMKKASKDWRDWAGCQACMNKPCNCNGMLLSLDQIRGWISSETQKTKKKKRKNAKKDDENDEERRAKRNKPHNNNSES